MTTDHARRPLLGRMTLLGPAFVAGIAYVDPGNFATNTRAGAAHGYLLLWVVVAANLLAVLVQYLSAKLRIGSGESLAVNCRRRYRPWVSTGLWLQAQAVSVATDVAELLGGAVALNLLLGLPLFPGVLLVGATSLGLLLFQGGDRDRRFQTVVIVLFVVIAVCMWGAFAAVGIDPGGMVSGLQPRLAGADTVLLATAMLGATLMPHAIYLHSALPGRQFGDLTGDEQGRTTAVRASLVDVMCAMAVAGGVNVAMLLLAAGALSGRQVETLEQVHSGLLATVGAAAAMLFAVSLLASGIASTAVATYAGSVILEGFRGRRYPVVVRRLVSLVPAVAILAAKVEPTTAMIFSQLVLSIGIPFALFPLVALTSDRAVMGSLVNGRPLRWTGVAIAAAVSCLNLVLVAMVGAGISA